MRLSDHVTSSTPTNLTPERAIHKLQVDLKNMATVYAIGSNGSGQLGIGHKQDVSVPKQVLFDDENIGSISEVKAGGKPHSTAIF